MRNHLECVVVTGATSGIGEQLTRDYAEQGVKVYACGRNKEKLNELVKYSSNITPLPFDITHLEQVKQAFESIETRPNLWVFNAGDCEYIDDGVINASLIARIMAINVVGLANCVEASQNSYVKGDQIAIIGSIASEVALPRAEAYGASKAAVSYFSRCLSLPLKDKGVTVSTVFPGFVETPLTQKNTFPMPMLITAKKASLEIRDGIEKKRANIYFPARFTSILRVIGLFPYAWQNKLVSKLSR